MKKKLIQCLLLCCFTFSMVACASSTATTKTEVNISDESINEGISILFNLLGFNSNDSVKSEDSTQDIFGPLFNDISTWDLSGDVRFVPVEIQYIDYGYLDKPKFITFVDLKTGRLYLYVEKFNSESGVSFTPLEDEFYDGDLDSLRLKYGYKEE